MIKDYSINLMEIRKCSCLDQFHTDIRYVFGFLQKAGNGEQLDNYMEKHKKEFINLDEAAYDLICAMSHSEELQQYKTNYQTNQGGYDMCQAIKDMVNNGMQDGIKVGEAQGIQLAKQVFQMSIAGKTLKDIAKECGITQKKVRSILG